MNTNLTKLNKEVQQIIPTAFIDLFRHEGEYDIPNSRGELLLKIPFNEGDNLPNVTLLKATLASHKLRIKSPQEWGTPGDFTYMSEYSSTAECDSEFTYKLYANN